MSRAALSLVVLVASHAFAEGAWLTAKGRVTEGLQVGLWGGPRTLGAGLVIPNDAHRAAAGVEGLYNVVDRTGELRGTGQWQLNQAGLATGSVTLGLSAIVVPDVDFDLGFGPHAGLNLSLGSRVFTVDFGLQTGVDLFIRQHNTTRFPQRALIGFTVHVSRFTLSVMARVGVDFQVNLPFVGRGEFVVALGWLP